jgi:hypothetical protein
VLPKKLIKMIDEKEQSVDRPSSKLTNTLGVTR